jgi:transcriptional regulator with XRE-family HTH domain
MAIKTRNPIPEGFNTGALIKKALQSSGLTQTYVGRKTDRTSSTVMNMLKRKSVQASILHEFSLVMGIDLFRQLSDGLPEHIRKDPRQTEIDRLTLENQELKLQMERQKEDNAYLKKMIDIFAQSRNTP